MRSDLLNTLIDRQQIAHPVLPTALRQLYGGDLAFPTAPEARPYVIANFVSTLDGVVSYAIPGKSGGGEISGFDEADRFSMGLLRASVDAVIIGAGTLHATSPKHVWTAAKVYPAASELYDQYRQEVLKKPANPLNVIVSASGRLDPNRAVFHTEGLRTLIVTTEAGKSRLEAAGAKAFGSTQISSTQIEVGGGGGGVSGLSSMATVSLSAVTRLLKDKFGVHLLLTEGGPKLFGSFLEEHLIDELFLTVAPQIAGRSGGPALRPGLAEGVEFLPDSAPWLELVTAKSRGNHLYLRYRTGRAQGPASI